MAISFPFHRHRAHYTQLTLALGMSLTLRGLLMYPSAYLCLTSATDKIHPWISRQRHIKGCYFSLLFVWKQRCGGADKIPAQHLKDRWCYPASLSAANTSVSCRIKPCKGCAYSVHCAGWLQLGSISSSRKMARTASPTSATLLNSTL